MIGLMKFNEIFMIYKMYVYGKWNRVVPLYTEFDQLEFVHLITFPKNYWANKSFYWKFQLLVITELCYWVGL